MLAESVRGDAPPESNARSRSSPISQRDREGHDMQLDSVRELKQSLQNAVVTPLAEPMHIRSFGVAASPIGESAQHRTIALGVARRSKREYALAVRVQRRGLENSD